MKKISAFFLALALCLGLAVPAFAAGTDTSAELQYSVPDEFLVSWANNFECKVRYVVEGTTGKLGAPNDFEPDSYLLVPTSEEFSVGAYNLTEDEPGALITIAWSDPDNDGIYDQRLFQEKKNSEGIIKGYDVLPIPEDGAAYKMTDDVVRFARTIALPGFKRVEGGYACNADRLHDLFGDNTIIFFYSNDNFLGQVLLSAGAFDDVAGRCWYSDPVAWAADKGITTGTGEGIFEPGSDCTQSQILTFLWRAEGKPQAAKAPVDVEEWHQDAINWAYEKGMIDSSFDGSEPCTRATAVNYMWQAKGKPTAAASSFTDMNGYSEDFIKAVSWASEKKITTGVAENQFDPGSVCNRAQIATFLYRAYNN